MLKAALLKELIPESLTESMKHLEHFHLALFFIWRRFYEVVRRLFGISYKVHNTKGNLAQHKTHHYLWTGKLILL